MEEPLDPPCEQYIYTECIVCEERILMHDEMHGYNDHILWVLDDVPCCSDACVETYLEELL